MGLPPFLKLGGWKFKKALIFLVFSCTIIIEFICMWNRTVVYYRGSMSECVGVFGRRPPQAQRIVLCVAWPLGFPRPWPSPQPRALGRTLVLQVKASASHSNVVAKQPPAATPGRQRTLAQRPLLHLPAPDGRLRAWTHLHRSSTCHQLIWWAS